MEFLTVGVVNGHGLVLLDVKVKNICHLGVE
jgi:hypothetical protein